MPRKHAGETNLRTMGRRHFLVSTALATVGLSAAAADRVKRSQARVDALLEEHAARTATATPGKRPNILLITTDQQWAGAMRCAGNPHLATPAMDHLAATGARFDAAYTPNPICVPARTSYMTGTASHENGVITNLRENQVSVTAPSLARHFQQAGYDTGYVGKWHIPRSIDDTDWSGFGYRAAIRSNRVDFDIPAHCADFMLQPRENPFFLVASFVNPHDICEWARRLSGMEQTLPNGEIGDPPPPENCPPFRNNRAIPPGEPSVVRTHQAEEAMARAYPTRDWAPVDGRWRQYLWGYYRMVELVDRYIGQVLDVLRRAGLEENTVVVFTSDHGDGMGSHLWNQKTIFYDEISRVPFIVRWMGHTPPGSRHSHHLVNIGTDLFPTLFDFAGIEAPPDLRGISAAPAALGQVGAPSHDYIVSENNHHRGVGHPTSVHGRMVRSARYKYIRYNQGDPVEQLFDMENDPGETRDLTTESEAADILDDHRRMLNAYIRTTGDDFPPVS